MSISTVGEEDDEVYVCDLDLESKGRRRLVGSRLGEV